MAVRGTITVADEPRLSDAELLRLSAGGDPLAFDRIVAAHRERITRLVWRLLAWRGDVEDVVQDVFLIAWRKLRGFRGESSLSTWLAGIAVNRCRAVRRKWIPSWHWLERLWRKGEQAAETADSIVRDEVAQQVRDAVAELPAGLREVVVLYFLEDHSAAEISAILRISEDAINVRLHRARQRLRELLKDLAED